MDAPPFQERALCVGPYLQLCVSQPQFDAAMAHLSQATHPFVNPGKTATTHVVGAGDDGSPVCIVCINPQACKNLSGTEVACVLVHEAVHVWQAHREHIGERTPGHEHEAYAIQWLSLRLMDAYRDQALRCDKSVTASLGS